MGKSLWARFLWPTVYKQVGEIHQALNMLYCDVSNMCYDVNS